MPAFLTDLRRAARLFRQAPGFTAASLAALSLGIAANTAIFSVVDTVLLQPLAYPDPGRVVMFQNVFPAGRTGSAAPTEFQWWREARAFQDVSAYDFGAANWTAGSSAAQIPIMHVSADFFRLCGAHALDGRTFTPSDDLPHAPRTVVLAYPFWQRSFAADPQAVGRRITLNGESYEIVGVLAPQLAEGQVAERSSLSGDLEINQPPDAYLAFQLDPDSSSHGHFFNAAGRLRSGVTLAAANAQLQAGYTQFALRWPGVDMPGRSFAVQPLQDAIVQGVRNSLRLLLAAVGLVLLIACANVANLLLARATGRQREIAIRAALGAGRIRIVRQLLTESLMLSLAGGLLGLAAGWAGIRALLRLIPGGIPRIGAAGANVHLDWRVLAFTLAVSLLTGIVFGLAPALTLSRADLSIALQESGARGTAGVRHTRTRALLVTAEVALAVVLSMGAALLIRSFLALRQVNPGFDAQNVLVMRTLLAGPEFARPANVTRLLRAALRRIRALPGVEAAAATCCVPLEDRLHGAFQIAGRPPGPDAGDLTGWTLVSAGYFETFRIPLLRGRAFTERDESGPPVVIINQAAARRFWPHSDPLRDQIVMGNGIRRQIVGVAGDVREEAVDRQPRLQLYIPSSDGGGLVQEQPWAWVVRTRTAPEASIPALESELRAASGGLPVAQVRRMQETVSRSLAAERFNTLVLTVFGGAALLLAAIGIYGLMACSVAQRVPEIGIRLALGAQARDIRNMVIRQGLRPALAGIVLGLAAAFDLARWLAGFLFGVQPWEPAVFLGVPAILAGVALVAVWLPAIRAGRVDPLRALRHQ